MKRKMKRTVSLILCLLLLSGVICASPLTAFADGADENPVLLHGACGADANSDVEYYCFKDGSMAIFGTGAIKDYTLDGTISTAPWYSYDFNTITTTLFVTKIAVEYGVTAIGDYCFYLEDNYPYKMIVQLNNIDISNTVTSIGKYAFYNQKIQQVVIPPTVTHIGANAFQKCTLNTQKGITYYGNPAHLTWDTEGDVDAEFPNGMTVHILSTYSEQVDEFNAHFAYKHITFVADASNPYAQEGEALDRNIAVYYGSVNSNVFGGAAPFVIVGRFDGKKKSVTYGSNGFASCVQEGTNYYILTDNTTGALNLATVNSTSGKVTGYSTPARSDLQLHITHSYIGTNTVKMKYSLKNTSDSTTLSGLKLGGTGDIKIGADDKAAIEPLMQEVGGSSTQVGFYMKSGKDYDKDSNNDYATLGFIGKNVSDGNDGTYSDATFFYGEVAANKGDSAAGAKTLVLIPERVFNENTAAGHLSQETGTFNQNKDSGMSFYWDNITLKPNQEKEYAVLFSVYGASNSVSAGSMIKDLNATFYNVTWKDWDGSELVTQVVKAGDTPVYPGAAPTRPRDNENNAYTFSGWTPTKSEDIDETSYVTEYTAAYTSTHYQLFRGHSLTLRGDIGVNFFVDVTPEQVRDGVTIRFNWYDQNSSYTLHESDFVSERGLYRARCNVSAAEMTDNIHAVAYFGNTKYTRETDDYSVRQYALQIINPTAQEILDYRSQHPTEYVNLRDLVKKMLDYGTKAQIVFNHNNSADKYANKDVDYTMDGTIGAAAFDAAIAAANGQLTKSDMNANTGEFGLKYYTTSIVFLSKTSMRHYYTVTDRTLYDTAKVGANFTVYENKPPYVYFELQDISASKLDTLQAFTIDNKTYYYSVLDFAKSLLDEGRSDEQKDLGKATYWYNQAANTYFGN